MEVAMVKCEPSTAKRHFFTLEGDVAKKHVKRRRRDPISRVMNLNDFQAIRQLPAPISRVMSLNDFQAIRQQPTPISRVMSLNDIQANEQQAADQPTSKTTASKRSSKFRGVSRHKWTGRYEAHLWDKGSWNVAQNKKGKQVYLGAYDEEESAARAYDLAALKYWGATTTTNFPVFQYKNEIEIMQNVTREEYLASLRRKSSGFSRGVSKYRGVARHHHNGRWEARIGRVFGNKHLYLGTYSTQEEAARAYDIAAIKYRGIGAVTNFNLSTYVTRLRPQTNELVISQKQQSNVQPLRVPEFLPFHTNTCTTEYLSSSQKQEAVSQMYPNRSTNKSSSSPTALSLLFRSSIFKELVEKNSSSSDEETDGEDDTRSHSRSGSDNDYGSFLYNELPNIPFVSADNTELVCSDSTELPSFGLEEEIKSWSSFCTTLL